MEERNFTEKELKNEIKGNYIGSGQKQVFIKIKKITILHTEIRRNKPKKKGLF